MTLQNEWAPIENWMRTSYIPNLKLTQFLNENVLVTDQDVKDDFIKKNVKDRMATFIINNAEKEGLISKGDTLCEATSGNSGIAFAMLTTRGR